MVLAYFYRHPTQNIFLTNECFEFTNTRDIWRLLYANAKHHNFEVIQYTEILDYITSHEEFHSLFDSEVKVLRAVFASEAFYMPSEACFRVNTKYLTSQAKRRSRKRYRTNREG